MGLQRRAHLRSLMNKKSGLSERQSFFHAYFTTTPNKKSYPIADRIFCLISIAKFLCSVARSVFNYPAVGYPDNARSLFGNLVVVGDEDYRAPLIVELVEYLHDLFAGV